MCVCVCVCVCVCHYEKKIADVVLVVSSTLLCCSKAIQTTLWERVLLLSSVSASQNFHCMLHFFVASL